MDSSSGPVCVTGATGFAAAQTVKDLLAKGYTVRGTCRSLDESKVSHLTSLPGAEERLKLFKADLLADGSFDEAISGCIGVFHMASPFFMGGSNKSSINASGEEYTESNLLGPAVEGTLNVLRSCKKAGTVKKIVVTSSTASVYCDFGSRPDDYVYTEADWSDEDKMRANGLWYPLSKQLAEKAAYKFVEELPSDEKMSIATILPTLIIGDMLQPALNTSNANILGFLDGSKALTNECKSIVDVRDVSASHIAAYESALDGRFLCIGASPHWSEVCQILKEICPNEDRIPTEVGDTPSGQVMGPKPPLPVCFSCKRLEDLGVKFHSVKEMCSEAVKGLRAQGFYDR
eukprot:TRINITY_DN32361_c0_g1_i1.p1 TRINITY_DN32361_c0_g1~~TRINITY_DN32361_c0_g1_i1.p1  ORF type:complete len:360 (+),score=45.56 TRINITY_DN32361_c0_g1_i1:45-1082(+)